MRKGALCFATIASVAALAGCGGATVDSDDVTETATATETETATATSEETPASSSPSTEETAASAVSCVSNRPVFFFKQKTAYEM